MKFRISLLIALWMICLNVSAQQKHNKSAQDKLYDKIFTCVSKILEVKSFLNSSGNDPQSKHALIIDDEPHAGFKYYVVKMGYDGDMFRTLERFCVDPKTFKVYYWDTFADDVGFSYSAIIPLDKWRIYRKTAEWTKPHTYKAGKLVPLKE